VRVKTRHFEKFKINISTGVIIRHFLHESAWIQRVFYSYALLKNGKKFKKWQKIYYDCFGLCNVLTGLDLPSERLFCEDFNGGFCFKEG
jgi:hypothetical protein